MPPNINKSSESAQKFVPIKEIVDGAVILKDGSYRAVILTSSLNMALKSEDERRGIFAQFQNMLNSLDFSVQIHIESRQIDIRPYITLLEAQLLKQDIELIRIQTQEYINFVKGFTNEINIMKKGFFVVVPYSPGLTSKNKDIFSLFGKKTDTTKTKTSREEHVIQLNQRVDVIINGLSSVGLRSKRLNTEELVELYYKAFNPSDLGNPAKSLVK